MADGIKECLKQFFHARGTMSLWADGRILKAHLIFNTQSTTVGIVCNSFMHAIHESAFCWRRYSFFSWVKWDYGSLEWLSAHDPICSLLWGGGCEGSRSFPFTILAIVQFIVQRVAVYAHKTPHLIPCLSHCLEVEDVIMQLLTSCISCGLAE